MSDDQIEKSHSHSIRFPQGLYEQIKEKAQKGMRSFNSQVLYLIMRGLDAENPPFITDFPPIQDIYGPISESHE